MSTKNLRYDDHAMVDNDDLDVIQAVLYTTYPPTNPSVLLKAARNWYLDYGAGPVMYELISWVADLQHMCPPSTQTAREQFAAAYPLRGANAEALAEIEAE